jgi:uncharacterized membrane protein YphA (DoxX/SURF4 family)
MKKWIVEIICIAFALLFIYTAVSKLLDFEKFRAVIGQSPLITGFAAPLSILVPVSEIVIGAMVLIPRYRTKGLYASFAMMMMFTAYIIVLVTLSDQVPCSCGGVIAKMTWDQHLYFNIFFMILALVGMLLQSKMVNDSNSVQMTKMAKA